MQWSMPRRVLQVVAGLIGFVALSAFTLGVVNAPMRGRLPGERNVVGAPGAVAPVEATEAMPLSQDRIQGAVPAVELTPEEKAQQEAGKLARSPTDVSARVAAPQSAAAGAPASATPTLQTRDAT